MSNPNWYDAVKERGETGHTKLEILLARALYKHGELLASVYVQLGKKTIPIYDEMQQRMRELPPESGPWIDEVSR